MATKLTKTVTREIKVKDANGIEGDVCVTISASGITFHKGRRKLSLIPWEKVAKLTDIPMNAPAKYMANHIGWLVELSRG